MPLAPRYEAARGRIFSPKIPDRATDKVDQDALDSMARHYATSLTRPLGLSEIDAGPAMPAQPERMGPREGDTSERRKIVTRLQRGEGTGREPIKATARRKRQSKRFEIDLVTHAQMVSA